MFFDREPGPVFRPPSEANSFILRVTVGCSHNKCTYCNMYRSVDFHIKKQEDVFRQIADARATGIPVRRVFLADGDALVLSTQRLLMILKELYTAFPKLQRVSAYAGPKAILGKTAEELQKLRAAGLKLLYYGLETGDDDLLAAVCKGVTAGEAIKAGQMVKDAGMKLSMMVIVGLAGVSGSEAHARYTAKAVNAIQPDMLSALTLMLYRGSELRQQYEKGEFSPLTPRGIMKELADFLAQIELPQEAHCIFRSNHISNYLPLAGNLPADKQRMIKAVEQAFLVLPDEDGFDPYNNVETF